MANWNEIAGDHHTALSWSGGLNRDSDGYPLSPPCNDPSMSGGLDGWFAQAAQRQVSAYRCKFCRGLIGFLSRKPYNVVDGTPHRCLANSRSAAPTAAKEQTK
jgi:hypothetical protein